MALLDMSCAYAMVKRDKFVEVLREALGREDQSIHTACSLVTQKLIDK